MTTRRKKAKPNPQEAQARYFSLSRKRSQVVYKRHLAECEGNSETYQELDKLLSDLNEEIAELEGSVRA